MANQSRGPYCNAPMRGRLGNHNARLAITDRIILRPTAGGQATDIDMSMTAYDEISSNRWRYTYVPYGGDVYCDVDVGFIWNQVAQTYSVAVSESSTEGVHSWYGSQSEPASVTIFDGSAEHTVVSSGGSVSIELRTWNQDYPYRYFTVYSNTTGSLVLSQSAYQGNVNKVYVYHYKASTADFNQIWYPSMIYES